MILKERKRHFSAQIGQSFKQPPEAKGNWGAGKNFLTIAPALPNVSGFHSPAPHGSHGTVVHGHSGGSYFPCEEAGMAPHEVVFLETTAEGKLHATRSQKDRERNPDRICLDRRGLTHLPMLIGEGKLRLLSLQHNLITRLDGLQDLGIGKLVFLDVYDNQVQRIEALDNFDNLRVLLIGKNRLKRIEGLQTLTKLEVLDLHGNQISQVTGLAALCELKVLNLAGNQIRAIGPNDLDGLTSLQELNLRRNRIKKLLGFKSTRQLRKLFLSNNEILTTDDMVGVCEAVELREITVDGNPVALGSDCTSFLVSFLPKLNTLNRMEIAEQVRKNAMLWRIANADAEHKDRGLDAHRAEILSKAKANWELLRNQTKTAAKAKSSKPQRSQSEEVPNHAADAECFKLPPILATFASDKSSLASDSSAKVSSSSKSMRVERGNTSNDNSTTSPPSESSSEQSIDTDREEEPKPADKKPEEPPKTEPPRKEKLVVAREKHKSMPGKVREHGGDYLIEICGRCLNVYGQGALRFIDRPWNPNKAGDVTTVRFNYVNFTGIVPVLGRLKQRFPNAENFVFREANVNYLGQLNALADAQGLSSLQIDAEGNPICQKNWRSYAIYRLSHWGLKVINGREVTDEDVAQAEEEFRGLGDLVLWSLPDSLLQPLLARLRIDGNRSGQQQSAKQWLWNADSALRSVVGKEALQWRRGSITQDDLLWRHKARLYLGYVIDLTSSAVEKLKLLDSEWPSILNQIIRDTLVDYSHLESYMKTCMQQLQ